MLATADEQVVSPSLCDVSTATASPGGGLTSTTNQRGVSTAMFGVQWLDVILLVASAPFVLLFHLPVIGYLVGLCTWVFQRIIADLVAARASKAAQIREFIGLTLGSTLARAWLVALAILGVGLTAGRSDGLAAGLCILSAFSVYFLLSIVTRKPPKASK